MLRGICIFLIFSTYLFSRQYFHHHGKISGKWIRDIQTYTIDENIVRLYIHMYMETEFLQRSSYLTIMNFFVFLQVENRVFKSHCNSENLQQRIIEECALITSTIAQNAFNITRRRINFENNEKCFNLNYCQLQSPMLFVSNHIASIHVHSFQLYRY